MPITATIAALAALSLAALPPTLGFIGKEMLLEASLAAYRTGLTIAIVFASMIFVTTAGFIGVRPFFGKKVSTPNLPHDGPPVLWSGPAILAALGVVFAATPSLVDGSLLRPAVEAITREAATFQMALWHGFNLPLALSAVSLLFGWTIYARPKIVVEIVSRLQITSWWGPQRWYGLILAGLNSLAELQTRLLQSGYLRYYLTIIIVTILTLAGGKLVIGLDAAPFAASVDARFHEWLVAGVILFAALAAVRLDHG